MRVPVYRGHSESINVEFERSFDLDEVYLVFETAPGILIMDDVAKGEYPLAIECEGKGEVRVGRIRRDFSVKSGINMWVVSDNLLKGAALNTVQIAEKLIHLGLVGHESANSR